MEITVAMCAYNPEQAAIVRALDGVVAQLRRLPSSELLLIDNNSTPPLDDRGYLDEYPVRLIVEATPGLTAAREAAINCATGDIVVFVDDDNILDERYLATVLELFAADPRLGLVGGSIEPEYASEPPSWFSEFEPWLAVRRYAADCVIETAELPSEGASTRYFPIGAGFAIRRELARAHQEDGARTLRIEGRQGDLLSSGEDLDLGFFVLSQGYKLAVSGRLTLTHIIPASRLSWSYLQRMATGSVKSSLALEAKWGTRFGRPVYPLLSMPIVRVAARALVASALSVRSPPYRIKRALYAELLRARWSEYVHSRRQTAGTPNSEDAGG